MSSSKSFPSWLLLILVVIFSGGFAVQIWLKRFAGNTAAEMQEWFPRFSGIVQFMAQNSLIMMVVFGVALLVTLGLYFRRSRQ